jgi:hypothetical protein
MFALMMDEDWHLVAEEARAMLQGVGSRFDFHMNKTLCDLRSEGVSWSIVIVDLFLGQGRSSTLSLTFQNRWEHYTISGFVYFIMSALTLH